MKKLIPATFIIFLFSAHVASAAVMLSEIAWMGSAASSADEWIELYNDDDSTADLTGWKIVGKGNAQIAVLSGSIPAKGYFLIERGDDETVPGVVADLSTSFGKGISNDGETLKLLDGGGNTVDSATGGKNWSKLGGDKTTKETAQRTSSGWITAPATPKAPNKTASLAASIATPATKAKAPSSVKVAHADTSASAPLLPAGERSATSDGHTVSKQEIISTTSVSANVLWQRVGDGEAEKRAWAWMIFAVLLVIAASVIIMRANIYEPTEADKYAIIEDIIEGKEDDDRLSDF